jgi:hypothetical protein
MAVVTQRPVLGPPYEAYAAITGTSWAGLGLAGLVELERRND